MKVRTQRRMAGSRGLMQTGYGRRVGLGYEPEKLKRKGSKKRPKKQAQTQRQKTAKLLGVNPKSLRTTKVQRRKMSAVVETRLGYHVPRLSEIANPRTHSVKKGL